MEQKFPRTTLIEVVIPAGVAGKTMQKTKFDFESQLLSISGKKVYVKGIEAYSNEVIPFSPLTSANPVATPADIQNGVVSILAENDTIIDNIPIADMVRTRSPIMSTPHVNDVFRLPDIYNIDWTKCFITTIIAPAGPLPFSYLFTVYYGYEPDEF